MGQKVNPHGIRVGVIKDWDSRWFASKKDFSDNLVEDHKIRTELKAQLKDAGVPKIEIERTVDPSTSAPRVTVNIYCAKPGMVIGKGGEERVALQNKLTKEYGKTVIVNVIEVKSAATNAQLVAEDIARQLENRVTFRRAMKQCMRNAMSPRDRATVPAKGIKAMCSGRLGGADIARTESYHEGTIPLQTIRADIEYGFAEAATTFGRIGVKVWIYKGEVLSQTLRTTPRTMDTSKPYQERRERRPRRDGDRRGGFGDRRQGGGFNRDRQGGFNRGQGRPQGGFNRATNPSRPAAPAAPAAPAKEGGAQ